jgi:hypothetical protein
VNRPVGNVNVAAVHEFGASVSKHATYTRGGFHKGDKKRRVTVKRAAKFKIPARPFVGPAAKETESQVVKLYEEAVEQTFK